MHETQLRNSLDTNATLMKGVTVTLGKSIQRLRRKLDEKSSSVPLNIKEIDTVGISDATDLNVTNLMYDDDHERSQHLDRDNLEILHIENTSDNKEQNKPAEPVNYFTGDCNDVKAMVDIEAIDVLYSPIDIPHCHPPLKTMEKIWSQNYPMDPIHQHSNMVQARIFPLHAPISDINLMERIFTLLQLEIITSQEEIIKKKDDNRDELCRDISLQYIRGTCLDLFSFCQYDPFLLEEMRKAGPKQKSATKSQSKYRNNTLELGKMASLAQDKEESDDKIEREGEVEGKLTKLKHDVDPYKMVCRYDLIGTCADDSCPYQHLTTRQPREKHNSKKMNKLKGLKKNTPSVQLPPLQLPPPPCPLQEPHQIEPSEQVIVSDSNEKENDASNPALTPIREEDMEGTCRINSNVMTCDRKRISLAEGSLTKTESHVNMVQGNSHVKKQRKDESVLSESSCNDVVQEDPSNINVVQDNSCLKRKRKYISTLSGSRCNDIVEEEYSKLMPQEPTMSILFQAKDKTGANEKKSVSMKSSKVAQEFIREDDFITLPDLPEIESESESVYDVLGDSNVDKESCIFEPMLDDEVIKEAHDSKLLRDEIHEVNNMNPVILTDVLSLFGFDIISDGGREGHTSLSKCKLQFTNRKKSGKEGRSGSLESLGTNIEMMEILLSLKFVVATVDSIRLCLHAGRYDLYHALSQLANNHLHQKKGLGKKTSDEEEISMLQKHYKIVKKVVSDIEAIADDCFFGRGSTTCGGIYHVQLCMGIICHFLRAYQCLLDKQCMVTMDATSSKRTLDLFVQYKSFMRQVLGPDYLPQDDAHQSHDTTDEKSRTRFQCIDSLDKLFTDFASVASCPSERTIRLIECAKLGQLVAKDIAKVICASEEYSESPQLIIDQCLHPLFKRIEKHASASRITVAEEAINNKILGIVCSAFVPQILSFVLFGPSVFTCLAAITSILKERGCDESNTKDNMKFHCIHPRHYGTLIEAKKLLMQIVQCFDFSGITGGTFEGQLLLAPFFGLLVNFLVSLQSFAKCQVLLETTIHSAHASSSVRNWSIYSELLWSQLLQLQMIFPSRNKLSINTLSHTSDAEGSAEGINTSSDNLNIDEPNCNLPRRAIDYGVHLNKIFLPGDSHFTKSISTKKFTDRFTKNVKSICAMLSSAHCGNGVKKISLNMKNSVIDRGLTCCLPGFPYSLLLLGSGLKHLHLNCCGLESLPTTFGLHFKGLNILKMSHNRLSILPSSFAHLQDLESLDITGNCFSCIPPCLPQSTKFSKLAASKNLITSMEELCCYKHLEQVDLRDNKIDYVPTTLSLVLTDLSQLQLEGNPILPS